jgi:Ca2+:H+ antiporter
MERPAVARGAFRRTAPEGKLGHRKGETMKGKTVLYTMLVFVPASLWLGFTHASPVAVFVVSCLAILPLAGLMGEATEHLAHHTTQGTGGLLNATFGNAAELIIGFMALRAGETEIVKASLTGSIIGNMLMVLGLAMLLGGWKHKELRFNRMAAETGSSMMLLAVVALVIPAIYATVTQHREPQHIESISLDISYILILTYVASLVFQLKTHQRFFSPEPEGEASGEGTVRPWSIKRSSLVLAAAAVFTGFVSEVLVHAVDKAGTELGVGKVFMGVVVVAMVGNAAEHSTAVLVAMKNKMDLALGIAMGSSMQIALFVAPVLVIAGHMIGQPLGLEFTLLEVAAVMLSVLAVTQLVQDGRTNWFEGVQLLAVYAILAVAFYFI